MENDDRKCNDLNQKSNLNSLKINKIVADNPFDEVIHKLNKNKAFGIIAKHQKLMDKIYKPHSVLESITKSQSVISLTSNKHPLGNALLSETNHIINDQFKSINNYIVGQISTLQGGQLFIPNAITFSEKNNSIQNLLNHEAFGLAKQMRSQIDTMFPSSLLDRLEEQSPIGNLLSNTAISMVRKENDRFKSIFKSSFIDTQKITSQTLGSSISKSALEAAVIHNKTISNIFNSTLLAKLNGVNESLFASTLAVLDVTSNLYSEFGEIDRTEFEEYRESIEQSKISRDNSSLLSTGEYIAILLSIILHIHSLYLSNQSNKGAEKIKQKMNDVETTIVSQLYLMSKQLDDLSNTVNGEAEKTEYVVIRSVNIRTHSSTGENSHVITVLHPNQIVELLKRDKKWIYVGYFDYIENIPKTGWVSKKYLKRIK